MPAFLTLSEVLFHLKIITPAKTKISNTAVKNEVFSWWGKSEKKFKKPYVDVYEILFDDFMVRQTMW